MNQRIKQEKGMVLSQLQKYLDGKLPSDWSFKDKGEFSLKIGALEILLNYAREVGKHISYEPTEHAEYIDSDSDIRRYEGMIEKKRKYQLKVLENEETLLESTVHYKVGFTYNRNGEAKEIIFSGITQPGDITFKLCRDQSCINKLGIEELCGSDKLNHLKGKPEIYASAKDHWLLLLYASVENGWLNRERRKEVTQIKLQQKEKERKEQEMRQKERDNEKRRLEKISECLRSG